MSKELDWSIIEKKKNINKDFDKILKKYIDKMTHLEKRLNELEKKVEVNNINQIINKFTPLKQPLLNVFPVSFKNKNKYISNNKNGIDYNNVDDIKLNDKNIDDIKLNDKNIDDIKLNNKNIDDIKLNNKNIDNIKLNDKNLCAHKIESKKYYLKELFNRFF